LPPGGRSSAELAGHVAHADLVERRDLAPVELLPPRSM
jgi:hypothetical protein